MLRAKILAQTLGTLLSIETFMLMICLAIALCYGDDDVMAFTWSVLIVGTISIALRLAGRRSGGNLNRRESYLVVATTWIIFSALGMLPFLFSGSCTSLTDAFYEAMSGFTTTGSTIIDVDAQPHALLFWRSLTQFVGGLGIVFFTIALIPADSDSGVRLFSAEVTGLSFQKIHPRIRTTVKWLFSIYTGLTLGCAAALCLCGMDLFDAINHAMTTLATGGFSTHADGIMYFDSAAVEYVIVIFMFIASISFYMLLVTFQKRSLAAVRQSAELRFFALCIVCLSVFCAAAMLIDSGHDVEHALRSGIFNVVSFQSSTGFVSEDLHLCWRPVWVVLLAAGIVGGCAGSTSGGIKCVRLQAMFVTLNNYFKHMIHPRVVTHISINGQGISNAITHGMLAFLLCYVVLLCFGTTCLNIMGLSFIDASSITVSCLSNVGVCDGEVYTALGDMASLPDAAKWLCSFLMLAGRLEIFPLLIPLTTHFWKSN